MKRQILEVWCDASTEHVGVIAIPRGITESQVTVTVLREQLPATFINHLLLAEAYAVQLGVSLIRPDDAYLIHTDNPILVKAVEKDLQDIKEPLRSTLPPAAPGSTVVHVMRSQNRAAHQVARGRWTPDRLQQVRWTTLDHWNRCGWPLPRDSRKALKFVEQADSFFVQLNYC